MRRSRLARCTIKLVVPGRYTALSKTTRNWWHFPQRARAQIEKVKDMKLEVMPPKTKNNMNFQPE